ncbi:hypothetical protein EKN06_02980 [Croceicoccus ponticola]|uniref:Uncharacterized protein n=1 Tax=Croceicoccus ponticola TaxID=2217664 RepID=A0A437H0S1_9SPHN|nr:hypothetical protein [Croceicoccus ponticola]RVQ69179.1 hypothetical protein EKN06_02980 [Croceicoccus ponticola]
MMIKISQDRRATSFMASAHFGGLAIFAYLAGRMANWPDFAIGMTIGITLASLLALILFSRTDEYLLSLWHAGVSAGFIVVALAFVYAPVFAGWSDTFLGTANPTQAAAAQFAGMLAILAFYVGLHVRWLRSRA